jgi:hypothetical protein
MKKIVQVKTKRVNFRNVTKDKKGPTKDKYIKAFAASVHIIRVPGISTCLWDNPLKF